MEWWNVCVRLLLLTNLACLVPLFFLFCFYLWTEPVGSRSSRHGRTEQDDENNSPFHDHHHNNQNDHDNYSKQSGGIAGGTGGIGGLKDYEPVEVGAQVGEITTTTPTNNGAGG